VIFAVPLVYSLENNVNFFINSFVKISIFTEEHFLVWVGIAQSVQRFATDWTVWGSNPSGGEIFHTRPYRLWGPPNLPYNGYRVFPGLKRPGCGVDHPPPTTAEVKESVELYLYSSSGPSWLLLG
jgi:hypothetical protein